MPNKLFWLDGVGLKAIDLPQYPSTAWTWLSGVPDDAEDAWKYYQSVAFVYRAANLTATAISRIPFALVKGETDYDVSASWENKVGFMPQPKRILQLAVQSMFIEHKAYLFRERVGQSKVTRDLRYILPGSVQVKVNQSTGQMQFVRNVNGAAVTFEPVKDIVYFFPPDPQVEIGPGTNSRAQAMMSAAGIIHEMDATLTRYAKRGFIKPTLLAVKGVVNKDDRERIEGAWDKLMRGVSTYVSKIFNAEVVTPSVIGDGLGEIGDAWAGLSATQRQDILAAAGMPESILLSSAANYATAQVDYLVWAKNTLIPEADFIADTLNEQVFEPIGLRMEFRPEIDEAFQEEEVNRSGAFKTYVDAFMAAKVPNPAALAAQIVGIDLPADMEYSDLNTPEPTPEEVAQEAAEEQAVPPAAEEPPAPVPTVAKTLTYEQGRELEAWRRVALKSLEKNGDPLSREFAVRHLTEEQATQVRLALEGLREKDAVKAAFEGVFEARGPEAAPEPRAEPRPQRRGNLRGMAAALNAAIKAMDEPAPAPAMPNITINIPPLQPTPVAVSVAAPPPADVQVDVAAPNVTIQPAAVTVDAPVTVNMPDQPPAEVVVEKPKSVKVKRDADGKISGLEVK